MMSSSSSTIQRQDTTAVLHLNPTPEQTLRFDTSITLDDIPRPLPDPAQALTHEPATGDLVNSLFLPPPFALSWSDIEAIPPGNANPDMASKEDISPSNSQTSHSDSGSADTEVTDSAYDMQYPSSPASAFTHFGSSDPSIHGSPEWHATSAPLPSQHQFSAHYEYTGAGIDPASLSPHTHSHTPISPSYTSSPLTLPLEYHASPEVQMSDLHMPVSPHPQYEEAAGVDAHGNFHPDANHRVYNSNGHAHPEPPAQYIHPSFLSAPAVYEYESRSTSKAGAGGELQDDERMELTSEPYPHFQPNSSSTHFVPENAIAPAAGSNPRAKKGKVATRGRKRKSLNSTATSNECADGDDGKPASAKRRRSSSSSASSLQRPNSRRQRVIKQISDEEPKRPATTRVSRSAPSKAHTGPRRAHRGHQRSRYERGREEKQRRLNVRDDSVIVELNSDSDEDEGAVDDSECEYDTESSYIPSREVTPAVVPSATEAKAEVGKGKLHVLPHTGNIPAQTRKRSGCTKVSGSASASGSSASPPADNTSTQAPTALYALTYPYDFPGPAGLGSNTNTTTLSALATTDRRSRGIPLPVPVPNLTKKSRGRKVPALEVPVQLQLQLVDVVGRAGGLYGQRVSGESLESGPASVDGASRASSITGDLVQDGGPSGYPYPPQAPDMGENANTDANGGIAAAAIVAEDGGIEMGTTASGKKRTYLCRVPGCGKCFVRGEHLKRHVRSIHTYEKPHKCPYEGCGKSFSRRDNLGQHVRVHG